MLSSMGGGLGFLVGVTVGGLLVQDILGTKTWVGTANAASNIGTAAAAIPLSRYMTRVGRRRGLTLGYILGMVGAAVCVLAAKTRSYPLLMPGMMLFGVANTANIASRFAAADCAPPHRRARMVSMVIWASTVGVVLGPRVASSFGPRLARLGLPVLGGVYLASVIAFAVSMLIVQTFLRPDPLELNGQLGVRHVMAPIDVRAVLARPQIRLALMALVVGQVTMVSVMTVTPVHLKGHGYGLGAVGTVISGHVLGMFLPSPLTGWLSDRFGRVLVITGGAMIEVVACVLAATADPANHQSMMLALFLLGLGWNCMFVAGSALVVESAHAHERPRVQGITDFATYAASAVAAFASGLVVGTVGYPTMGVAGACIAGLAGVIIVAFRQVVVPLPVLSPTL